MSEIIKAYEDFVRAKRVQPDESGLPCNESEVNPILKPHQKASVAWAVRGGRRALFSAFGLGKSVMQLEIVRLVMLKSGMTTGLIVAPLSVIQEFQRDAVMLGQTPPKFIRTDAEVTGEGVYITNYESVREGKLDPKPFGVVSLDEASILRGLGGTKTFREFMGHFENTEGYRFVATATPSPNEYIELLAYAAFLGIMDVGGAKTRFFKRNSEKADQLTIHPHKEREFWLWVASWALFTQRPSDLGFSDEGYEQPPLDVRWHEVHSTISVEDQRPDRLGQFDLIRDASIGVVESSREKRSSLSDRIAKMMELRAEEPGAHRIIWHDLEAERHAIEAAIPDVVSVFGSQDLEKRTQAILDFSDGKFQELAAKPVIAGSGCNFQRHCHWAIFIGIGFKFNDFIQAIHRLYRFLQTDTVRIDLIYTDAERGVRETLERKWRQHNEMVDTMTAIIKEYGLAHASMAHEMERSIGVARQEASGDAWKLIHNDSVIESDSMESDSVDLILTSIPFGTQYEYSPSYNDFGHTDDDDHFWEQMGFLTPNLLRVLKPGRICAIHVKDRITPGGITGLGFQTVSPFHAIGIEHFRKAGFAYLGMKTIVTDVVRENAQTYRLGWTEQCKDGSRMGCGMPEYLLIFRKPPTDLSNGYADDPVIKNKGEYTRGRWQFDAHGFMKSSGNRLIQPEDFMGLSHGDVYKLFKWMTLNEVYDHEKIVTIANMLDEVGILPPSFMLCQPQSWSDEVWTDVTRMRSLNTMQAQRQRENHLCPMQFDIADRAITQYTNPGEVVFDPFAGLGSVPYCAVKQGRVGIGSELSAFYFQESVFYLRACEKDERTPSLFELIDAEGASEDPLEVASL